MEKDRAGAVSDKDVKSIQEKLISSAGIFWVPKNQSCWYLWANELSRMTEADRDKLFSGDQRELVPPVPLVRYFDARSDSLTIPDKLDQTVSTNRIAIRFITELRAQAVIQHEELLKNYDTHIAFLLTVNSTLEETARSEVYANAVTQQQDIDHQ